MFRKLLMVIGVCFVVFLAGCKGDDGAVGPAGPAGPPGAVGAVGPAGQGGGSAAILTTGNVSGTGTEGDLSFVIQDNLNAAQQAAYDSNLVVMVYGKSLNVWWPLPGIVQFTGNNVGNFTFVHGVDQGTFFVDILATGWSEDTDTAPTRAFDDFRIVIIPGGSPASARLSSEINWKSYEETIKALGLTDLSAKRASFFRRK
jgi:hypothetical protein